MHGGVRVDQVMIVDAWIRYLVAYRAELRQKGRRAAWEIPARPLERGGPERRPDR